MSHADQLLEAVRHAPDLLRSLSPYSEKDVRTGERLGWTTAQLWECLWRARRASWGYDFIEEVAADLERRRLLVRVGDRVKVAPRGRTRRRRR